MKGKPTFEEIFRDRLKDIEQEAKALGMNMTSVCEAAGVGRATPDRWKRRTPQTVEIVTKMEQALEDERQRQLAATGRKR